MLTINTNHEAENKKMVISWFSQMPRKCSLVRGANSKGSPQPWDKVKKVS